MLSLFKRNGFFPTVEPTPRWQLGAFATTVAPHGESGIK